MFFNWQKFIKNILEQEADERLCYWIYGEGRDGKTQFMKWLMYHMGAVCISGKKSDVLYCAMEHPSNIYIYNLTRSQEEYISYDAIEAIKDNVFMNSKFECKPILRPHPHVLILANFRPDKTQMTKDRWYIMNIQKRILPEEKEKYEKMKIENVKSHDDDDDEDFIKYPDDYDLVPVKKTAPKHSVNQKTINQNTVLKNTQTFHRVPINELINKKVFGS